MVFKSSFIKIYGWFNHRLCIYHDDVVAEARTLRGHRYFCVSGQDENLVREVSYKFLLSALGEALDLNGFHRVHAFGCETSNVRSLLIAPSGCGKSSLASLLCLKTKKYKLFSDESPLLHRTQAKVYAFPTRISLSPVVALALGIEDGETYVQKLNTEKTLFPFPKHREAESGRVDYILRGNSTSASVPLIKRCSRLSMVHHLFGDVVVGLGFAQMAEWMLRLHAVPNLIQISFSRLWALINLLMRAKRYYRFHMTRDAKANALCFERFHLEVGPKFGEHI